MNKGEHDLRKDLDEFFKVMLEFFPSKSDEYRRIIENYDEILATVIIEDVFMPEIIKLLEKNQNKILLQNIFRYFEKISCGEEQDLINIFSITVLETLGNDRKILEVAKKYMGAKTAQLQSEADRELGRGDFN